ncbi:cell death protein CED-3, partial [Aphelenchoides avenae]
MAHYSKATTASQLPYYQPDRVYKNFSRPKGLALIINNVHFARSSHREGSHVDKARFRQTMVNLEYDVLEAAENLPAQAMLDVARRFATDARHSSCHNCVVAVMTHGDYDKLYGSDDATIDVHEFVECFNARVAPGLAGKPKLFFIQACRGEKQDTGVQREASEDEADVRLRNI